MAADAALRQRAVIAAVQAGGIGTKPEELTLGDQVLPGEGRSLVAELAGQGEALRHQPAVDPDPLGGDVDKVAGQADQPLDQQGAVGKGGLEALGLAGLAALVENSIRWSCYEDQSAREWGNGVREGMLGDGVKAQRLQEWYRDFEQFCEWILLEFAHEDVD